MRLGERLSRDFTYSGGVGVPLALSRVEGSQERNGVDSKCDTNPLTLPKHSCYYPHRSNTNPTISRRNQKPGEATETQPRTQRLSPSQRPIHGARGTSESRHLLIPPGPVPPSLTTQAMEGPSTLRGTPPSRGPCRIGAPYQGSAYAPASTLLAKLNGPALPGLGPSSPYAAPQSSPSANSVPPMTTSSRMPSRTAVER